jgi:small conductance mechanosensitive channel
VKRQFEWNVVAGIARAILLCIASPVRAQEQAEEAPVAQAAEGGEATEQNPLVVEADALVASLLERRDAFQKLEAALETAQGEDALVIENEIAKQPFEQVAEIAALTQNLIAQEEEGLDTASYRALLTESLARLVPWLEVHVGLLEKSIDRLQAERDAVEASALSALERRLAQVEAQIDRLFEGVIDYVESAESIGLDAEAPRQYLARELNQRAELAASRLELAAKQRVEAEALAAELPDDAEAQAALRGADIRLEALTTSLTATKGTMERLGLEVAKYEAVLIQVTGEITAGVFDAEVALGLLDRWAAGAKDWVVESAPRVVFKLLLFSLVVTGFWLLARVARNITQRAVSAPNLRFSELLKKMVASIVYSAVMVFGVLMGLSQLGFELGPLLAGLGIAGFVLGFALQDSLANFAAGAMILTYRPYDVGDLIEAAGVFGRVSHMNLVSTTVLTVDNQTLVVPNGKIWGDVIKNVTAQKSRRVDMLFGISYGAPARAGGLLRQLRGASMGGDQRLLGCVLGRDARGEDALRPRGHLHPVPPARRPLPPGEGRRRRARSGRAQVSDREPTRSRHRRGAARRGRLNQAPRLVELLGCHLRHLPLLAALRHHDVVTRAREVGPARTVLLVAALNRLHRHELDAALADALHRPQVVGDGFDVHHGTAARREIRVARHAGAPHLRIGVTLVGEIGRRGWPEALVDPMATKPQDPENQEEEYFLHLPSTVRPAIGRA